ncbi:MAG: NADH-quinone oxidoreductase subunit NuoH [Chloroflexi bacterium]|nr:NADH-quinone oxidoreductase subunit NuoH [Chloroflexota bacterium]
MTLWPAGNYWAHFGVFAAIIIAFVLLTVMAFIWFERRAFGTFQLRWGPNRAGPFGFFQPVADAIKVLLKEDIVPAAADKLIHWLAPVIVFLPVLLIFAVIPLYKGHGLVPDLNTGILYVVAISTMSVVGVFMAGWASNNKYSLLGGMRAIAQMVSYEIPLVISIISIVLLSGSLSMYAIVGSQDIPFFLVTPLGFLIFLLSAMAEINRGPFDLLEADSEIVAGFHTEYSGMKFAMFYLAEYGHALAMSAIAATLFLGGWRGPGDGYAAIGVMWLLAKVFFIFFLLIWMRVTFPRLRVDQLMGFGWKFLFPLALINLFIVAAEVVYWGDITWWMILVNFGAAGVLILVWSRLFKLGGGRVEIEA